MALFLNVQKLKELWPVIAFILGLTVTAAQGKAELDNHEVRITKLETAPERLVRMETKLDSIQHQLDKMNL